MKKIAALLLLAGLIVCLAGCGEERHRVDYCGQMGSYENARDTYRAGERVKLYYRAGDAGVDYIFYLDDVSITHSYEEGRGLVVEFTMPDHDVKLECEMRSGVTYEP